MRHLVVGASGQVGGAIYSAARELGLEIFGTWLSTPGKEFRKLDITDRTRIFRLFRELEPSVVYVTAAMTNVDRCESEPDLSYSVNVAGIANLVDAVNRVGALLVLVSSDYVFDGDDGPYDEAALPRPVNVYGTHKLIAEHIVATRCEKFLIARTTVVYGWEEIGKNFVVRLKHQLSQGKTVMVPTDQIGTPTYNKNLARALIELGRKDCRGLVNVAGTTLLSRYEFALQVASIFGLDPRRIKPMTTGEMRQKAARPLKAGLVTRKFQNMSDCLTGVQLLGSEEGLRQMLKDDL